MRNNKKIFKVKKYLHFDSRKNNYKIYIKYIKDSNWVERHPFYPFVHYIDEQNKYNGVEIVPKSRKIFYASHIDRYIYQYYGYMLGNKYNKFAKQIGINKCSIAYRNELHKCNIEFACEVMKFLKQSKEAFVIVSDFKDFFDNLNHKYLKNNVKRVLNVLSLPNYYYKVLKSVCKFSYIKYDDILDRLGTSNKEIREKKLDRFFEIQEFRNIKKGLIHTNSKDYGIVQGSPISAILSNIYMIDFDKKINDLVTSNQGLYRRYSDDVIIIIPNITKGKKLYNEIMNIVNEIPNLKLSDKKTKCYSLLNNSIQELDKGKFEILKNDTIINYLGFTYNGKKVTIREKTVAKFYRKMYAKIKNVNYYSIKTGKNIGRRKLFKKYSHIGKRVKDIKDGNFLTYVDRAEKVFGNDADFKRQVKNSWRYLNKRLVKVDGKK